MMQMPSATCSFTVFWMPESCTQTTTKVLQPSPRVGVIIQVCCSQTNAFAP